MSYRSKRIRTVDGKVVDSDTSLPSLDSQPRSHPQRHTSQLEERNPASPTLKKTRISSSSTLHMSSAQQPRPPKPIAPGSLGALARSKPSTLKRGALTQSSPLSSSHKSSSSLFDQNIRPPLLVSTTIGNKPPSSEPAQLTPLRPPTLVTSDNPIAPPSQNENMEYRPSQPLNDNQPLSSMIESDESDDNELVQEGEQANVTKSKSFRSRSVKSKSMVPNWPEHLNFDEKEEALTIDADGNHKLWSGPIQPRDVDNLERGVRCIVHFNEFNQPIRKGGFVLVKYLAHFGKTERFFPIGEKTWHKVSKHYKVEIIEVIRAKFVIPDGGLFDKAILMRVAKHWRQFRYSLKMMKFDPTKRTKEQILKDIPFGHTRDNWIRLVEYWYSEKSKKLSQCGKEARASQSHVHTTGSTSYANKRADFVEANGKQPSHLEFFKLTHTKVGGDFVENTLSSQLLDEANATVEELVRNSSPTKSRTEIENDVFDKLMYEAENPKRPIGFGFGVKQSAVFGVHGILRNKGYGPTTALSDPVQMENMRSKMMIMEKGNQDLRSKVDQSNVILLQALKAIRTGNVSDEFLSTTQLALGGANSQVDSASTGNSTRNGSYHVHSSSSPS